MRLISRAGMLVLLLLFLVGSIAEARANDSKVEWKDSSYNFSKIKTVMIKDIEIDGDVSDLQRRVLLDKYHKEIQKALGEKGMAEAKARRRAELKYGVLEASDEELLSIVDSYLTAKVTRYQIDSYIIPAHYETKYHTYTDTWYDKDGHKHERTHSIPYQEYIPEREVPVASVDITFSLYDLATNQLILSRQECRNRDWSYDMEGVYGRITGSFAGWLKDSIKK